MREFQARKKRDIVWKKILHSKVFLLFLCVCVFFLIRGLIRIYDRYTTVRKDFKALHEEVQHLQKREKELDAYIQKIDTVEGKDYEIRKKLDVVKPGEKILYIVDTP